MMFAGTDPDLAAFVAATGAADTAKTAAIIAYLKAQALWSNVRFFPFKAAQNKGSGTTVFGLGGWTSNHIALVNGPTWGAAGIAFDAVDDRATLAATGINALAELYTFDRQNPAAASLADTARFGVLSLGTTSIGLGYLYTGTPTGLLPGDTASMGLTVNGVASRLGYSDIAWSAGASTQLVTRFSASGSGMWKSKTAGTALPPYGAQNFAPSTAAASPDTVHINANYDSSIPSYATFAATTRVALLLCKTSLTTPQREAITDLIDAL